MPAAGLRWDGMEGCMASYLDQIPKQLAARRQAFTAVKANPALMPSYWTILRSIASNAYDYMRNAVVGGCSFPDRPIYLSTDDAAFIDFGTTPTLLRQDYAWIEAARAGKPPPEDSEPAISDEREAELRRRLADMARSFGRSHGATRVYNLEAWLQEMYRDCLDVDYSEELQRQIDHLNEYMDSVPKALRATGLTGNLSRAVMGAFNLFKTITGSSHQLERAKMSFTDRRSFVNTAQQIEAVLTKADASLGSAAAGRSAVRELFGFWKDANYEMMKYTRELRALWAGTSLDDRITDLARLLAAVQRTLGRCSDEAADPEPQMPLYRADDDETHLRYAEVVEAFNAVMMQDLVLGSDAASSRLEMRRFGPLSAVIAPGRGAPRYGSEIRKLGHAACEEEDKAKGASAQERDMEVDRRVRYPLNCIVVPSRANGGTLLDDLADAWLEFNQVAYPAVFRGALDEARKAAPALFQIPDGSDAKEVSAHHARKMFGRLVAAFVGWMRTGAEPGSESIPDFAAFRDWALARMGRPWLLIPLRYRPLAEIFAEATPKRRADMWRRFLGPRFSLDRQLAAVNTLKKDWPALRDSLRYLPSALTRSNVNLESAFHKIDDRADPLREHKAMAFLRKFFSDDPDLKTALVTVESRISIEVETLRSQAESLGRAFQYEQAAKAMMARQASQIQEKRNVANKHIDQNLTGLMYALDGNYEAAVSTLSMCLTPEDKRERDECAAPPVPDALDAEWFRKNLAPLENAFEKKRVPGENGSGTASYEYVYYNLGQVYRKLDRPIEARMCFHGFLEKAPADGMYLYRRWAEEASSEIRARQDGGGAEGKPAGP